MTKSGEVMRTTDEIMTEILAQIAAAGNVRSRKMMGEYILYCADALPIKKKK